MFGGWPDIVRVCIALLLSGATVKIMDDALDIEYDLCRGKRTLAARLGRASLPYSLVVFGVSMAVQPNVSISILIASYCVGMFTRSAEILPTRVPAYVEVIIGLLVLCLLVGWRNALWAIAMMSLIDWLDDVMDRHRDRETGQGNLVVRFGLVEVLFGILIVFCLALYTQTAWTIAALVAWVVLDIVFHLTTQSVLDTDEGMDL